jgi:FHA domain
MRCSRCKLRPRAIGLICGECADEIATSIVPQQIIGDTEEESDGALVDQWGRAHALARDTEIGRAIASSGIAIIDVSVSRHHAWITKGRDGWIVRDAHSSNGTRVNRESVAKQCLAHGDRVGFGRFEFYFVLGVEPAARPPEPVVVTGISPVEATPCAAPLRILEPTGGNGGIVEFADASAQLTATQLELVNVLYRRMRDDIHLPRSVRGFVRSSELLGVLSWDTRAPDDTHVKQLVRRARRTMIRSGLGDLIESRHRFGYRLRVAAVQSL